jgi:hypothetical protein
MPAQRNHVRVADRDPRNVLDGDSLSVVGQTGCTTSARILPPQPAPQPWPCTHPQRADAAAATPDRRRHRAAPHSAELSYGQFLPVAQPSARSRVRSYASRISMISLPELVTDPSAPVSAKQTPRTHPPRRDHTHQDTSVTGRSDDRTPGFLLAAQQELTGRTPGLSRGR